ncbi:hypothetical protein COCSUDRAFT_30102 [Coccomyxa subellipsoidea C-169]|uniref:G domain-containing protein n=1 Tax=Coccomyxa subellipsoidea (strain C-169) TaxID=574566 RepID=I0YT79_COCSC|nr:hypothetical protein COCSUDRAFT_30102 [Coccomyxa subellipsoidea C-169]EIE21598.1 hypothetical protein COCSUDRAFT_30102 [Coccomyxa subellipsoidea C-169]|eukprot:XP_005646142.1 hypothetical protein COCSUDRAFT_30102 [Coccomyxa subellipsoidea C-169]
MIFPRSQLRTHTCLLSPGRSTGVHSSISRCPLGAVGGPQQRPALCSRGCRKRWQASRIAGVAVAASSRVTVFPAGKKQAKVALPACILVLTAADVVERRQELTQSIGDAIAAGATGVLLEDDDGTGGAQLYEAAIVLKDVLRGRAVLLIQDRTDIVAAAEADGVVLSSRGVPTVVARRSLPDNANLVGRKVATGHEAVRAAADGASLVILESGSGRAVADAAVIQEAKTQQGGNVPVIAALSKEEPVSKEAASDLMPQRAYFYGTLCPRLMTDIISLVQEVVPSMEEVGLLRDALKQLDQPFLMVVVGEFNSGKSTVINALLGRRFLAEGILPTTNEISVLKFRSSHCHTPLCAASFGFLRMLACSQVRYLPAALLRDLNIVDTPGTNVILERQQRLTEEYVPRADMVLFTMSADRPFTDSEVRFLKYIRQWGKKVVFLVNKVDILSGGDEVEEVAQFVSDNARRVLGVDAAKVLPVSARAALQAKLDATSSRNGFFGEASALHRSSPLETLDEEALARSGQWGESRFGELERFMVDFLVGGGAAGESLRLKLQTPLFVADALLEAARQQLSSELSTAEQEAEAVASVQGQLRAFRREMEADGTAQRAECRRLVATAVRRARELVDDVLQLSNREALSAYAARRQWREQREAVAAQAKDANADGEAGEGDAEESGSDTAVAALMRFEPKAAALVLEEEIREAVLSSVSSAVGAGLVGVVLTWILPTTLEDVLAIVLTGLAGYVALLNLPLRRAEAKAKLERVANNFIQEVEDRLKAELESSLDACTAEVNAFIKPLEEATLAVVERVRDSEIRRAVLADELEQLKQRAASVE